jgi:hypothetical protein
VRGASNAALVFLKRPVGPKGQVVDLSRDGRVQATGVLRDTGSAAKILEQAVPQGDEKRFILDEKARAPSRLPPLLLFATCAGLLVLVLLRPLLSLRAHPPHTEDWRPRALSELSSTTVGIFWTFGAVFSAGMLWLRWQREMGGIELYATAFILILVVGALLQGDRRLELSEAGVSLVAGLTGKVRRLRWPEIVSISERAMIINGMPQTRVAFELESGGRVTFETYGSSALAVAAQMQRRLGKQQMPAAEQQLDSGAQLEFGVAKLDARSVELQGAQVPLELVRAVSAHDGVVAVRIEGEKRPRTVPWSGLRNPHLFVALLERRTTRIPSPVPMVRRIQRA